MKKYFYKLACIFVLLMPCMSVSAQAPGAACSTAIDLDDDYTEEITTYPKTVWYTAGTWDLPLAVYFVPKNETDPAPEVEMDFSCTTGVYTDPIICSLFCKGGMISMPMPHKPVLETTKVDGKLAYYIALGEEYRNRLLKMGIDYNVNVYIKVTYKSSGSMSIAPDGMFANCMDGSRFMHLGESVNVQSEDKESFVVVPYVQWQYETILYEWKGTAPCTVAVSNVCDFDPTENSEKVLDMQTVQPGGVMTVTSELLSDYVNKQDEYPNQAGMYFAKFYSTGAGTITIKKEPVEPPKGDALLLEYNKSVSLNANDTSALYAISEKWNKATKLTTSTSHVFRMYVGTKPDFYTKDAIAVYQFLPQKEGHWLGLPKEEMTNLWKKTTEKYLYVRFECTSSSTLLPTEWEISDCIAKWKQIKNGDEITVTRGSNGAVYYCMYYYNWKGGDMTFQWKGTQNVCPSYIGDNCSFEADDDDSHVIHPFEIKKNSSQTIPATEIDQWESRVDEDGYLYIRFNPKAQAKMLISSTVPEETDPVYPAATISVKCDENRAMVVDVRKDQQISVSDENGNGVDQWDAVAGTPHTLHLKAGTYLLQGAQETVYILPMTLPADMLEAKAQPAGTTAGTATRISGPAKLSVQSGGNYVSLEPETLPATVVYMPDAAFGPVPEALMMGSMLPTQAVFADCYQGWAWQLPQSDKAQIAEVRAHENATVFVVPENTPVPECDDTDTTAVVTGSIDWYGKTYTETGKYSITKVTADGCEYTHTLHLTVSTLPHVTETRQGCGTVEVDGTVYTASTMLTDTVDIDGQQTVRTLVINVNHATTGELKIHECSAYTAPWGETYAQSGKYTYTIKNVAGCDSLVTLHLTIDDCDATYDTVYFCAGQNTEHDETVGLGRIMRYLPYVYESPAAWGGYMEGVIIQSELTRTLVDLNRAERNLYEHYKDELTPVRSVSWSLRPDGQSEYRPVVVENAPQWMEAGVLAMTVRFLCGEMYTANFATDITNTGAVSIPCKVLENGQVIIIRGGKKYTVFGQRVD